MKSDLEIAQSVTPQPISEVAEKLGLSTTDFAPYGNAKAKIDHRLLAKKAKDKDGKLILVTAISPTPAGEGKTTTSVGLADALCRLGKKTVLCLREPSLGPVFGMKGGAAGGGYAQVIPMEDINLHFTGDIHAIGAANNLLAAMVDNHIYQGNALGIDPEKVTWRRCVDMNDRQLRNITSGQGGKADGVERKDGFDITVASEVMAVFCLAKTLEDLKDRLSEIVVGYSFSGQPVTAGQLNAAGAMAALLKEAFDPNLVQTLEGNPAILHGGPFANIAHGCNSAVATALSLKLGDYVVTEAGFGADLGAEKFLDIKCRTTGLAPSAAVVVATMRALRHHGGAAKEALATPDIAAVKTGAENLRRHIKNLKNFGLPVVVALNAFPNDSDEEYAYIYSLCEEEGAACALSEVFGKGGTGGEELAKLVLAAAEGGAVKLNYTYPNEACLKEKITAICKNIYGAAAVTFSEEAAAALAMFEANGHKTLPVCIAKTQYSFSDDAALLAAPSGFTVNIRAARLSAGAGFVVALAGKIMTMPGLPLHPAADKITVDANGVIYGLF